MEETLTLSELVIPEISEELLLELSKEREYEDLPHPSSTDIWLAEHHSDFIG